MVGKIMSVSSQFEAGQMGKQQSLANDLAL
jgi:hypothetical protein